MVEERSSTRREMLSSRLALAVMLTGLLVSGCIGLQRSYVHPDSGQVVKCRSFGIGAFGTLVAIGEQQRCGDTLEAAGYVKQ